MKTVGIEQATLDSCVREAHPHLIDELDEVVLTCDLPDHGLAAGDIGTVVLVHDEGKGYEVEVGYKSHGQPWSQPETPQAGP